MPPRNFTYRGGEEFTFRGDEDLWLFVDGKSNFRIETTIEGFVTPPPPG